MGKKETIEEFLARGGKITKCKTYGIKKYSSFPEMYRGEDGITKSSLNKPRAINPQVLLDAAAGTSDEQAVIEFLESKGFEVN